MKTKSLLLVAGICMAAFPAAASTISYIQNNGTGYQTSALSGFSTFGDQMVGMTVGVTFSDNSFRTAIWAATGAGAGAATLAGFFTISESGDTFNANAWTLSNLSTGLAIKSFSMFGPAGDALFDRATPAPGTDGSANGRDFDIAGSYIATATYSDIFNLTGSAPVGDLFASVKVDFAATTLFAAGSTATFSQDTDSASVRGTIVPTVPDAGSTGLLLGLSFLAMATLKRRLANC